jgi:hypothetical protein
MAVVLHVNCVGQIVVIQLRGDHRVLLALEYALGPQKPERRRAMPSRRTAATCGRRLPAPRRAAWQMAVRQDRIAKRQTQGTPSRRTGRLSQSTSRGLA